MEKGQDTRYRRLIEQLVVARRNLGISQEELAKRLGWHQQGVSRVETGERRIDVVEFVDFVKALGLDATDLVRSIH